MKRFVLPIFAAILLLTALDASGQRWKLKRYEADINLGGVAFHGDIGVAGRPLANNFNGNRPSFGITPRFYLQQNLAVSLDLTYLIYAGTDIEGETHNRYYTFNSHSFQHFARLEYYVLGTSQRRSSAIYNRRGMVNNYNRIQMYLLAGVGGIMSKSKVKNLNNDGEEPLLNPGYDPALKYTAGFPVGGGIKFNVDPRWSAGIEATYTFTLSDKLDGYQSIWSDYLDTYYILTFKAVYSIRNDRRNRPIFNKYYR